MTNTSKADWLLIWSARGAMSIVLALSLAFTLGCGGVSEEDLNKIKIENQSLEVELEQEKQQADILDRALTNAYKERDRLVDLLNAQAAGSPPTDTTAPTDGTESTSTAGATQTAAGQTYLVKTGDTLSVIAQKNNTTVSILLNLNPYLMDRNNYMVWENDKIRLPR
jgi:LysM repeat protein